MSELLKITDHDGKRAVSARDLHAFLGNKKQFSDWIKHRINKYGLVENQDYVFASLTGEAKGSGGHNATDYALTLEAAKELSMVEGNAKGKHARLYFIECEKQALQPKALPSAKELAQMVILAEEEKERVSLQLNMANNTIKELAPKIEYLDKVLSSVATFHATSVAGDFGWSAVKLNNKLKEAGVIRKIDGHYVLHSKYQRKGYEDYRTVPYLNSKGEQCTAKEMVWTEKGRKFIHDLFGMSQTG